MNFQLSSNALESIFQHSSTCMAIYDPSGKYIKGNKHFLNMFQGEPPAWYSVLNDPIIKRNGYDGYFQKLLVGEPVEIRNMEYNTRLISEDLPDNPILLNVLALGLFNPDGSLKNILTLQTSRKINEQDVSTEIEKHKLITGGVAHDLNNILTTILVSTELALDEMGQTRLLSEELVTKARSAMKEIVDLSKTATELVYDLVTLSVNKGCLKEVVDLNDFISQLIKYGDIKILCKHVDAKIKYYSKESLMAPVSRRHLRRAFFNLICNAIDSKATSIRIKASEITVGKLENMLRPGQYAVIEFVDNGSGIDNAVLPHIFKKQYSTKSCEKRSGSGLGLMVVRNVVEAHKGHIEVKSRKGKGTLFRIFLPLKSEELNE